MILGCIGDDFTGSSDLANTLSKQGMRSVQYTGVPNVNAADDVEAGVVALKSRSIPVAEAVAQSLAALEWLKAQGCEQFFFKYCSTFDSTPDGNIGPVCDALADALDAHKVIVCPAFPGAGRSVYQGHLFVNDVLLNESGLENHPLTPMTDADIRRWLRLQSKSSVGHISATDVLRGSAAISAALDTQHKMGKRLIVVDATRDEDLMDIGAASAELPLITGGSGVAMGLPSNFAKRSLLSGNSASWVSQSGKCIALSGSCSNATREQISIHKQSDPAFEINASDVIGGKLTADEVAKWLLEQDGLPLAYSSADPKAVADIQNKFGREKSAEALENLFSEVAQICHQNGATRIITAGGETSGAIVEGLNLSTLEIGPEIAPGVPALRAGPELVVALKSGNFGAPTFFKDAERLLGGDES